MGTNLYVPLWDWGPAVILRTVGTYAIGTIPNGNIEVTQKTALPRGHVSNLQNSNTLSVKQGNNWVCGLPKHLAVIGVEELYYTPGVN